MYLTRRSTILSILIWTSLSQKLSVILWKNPRSAWNIRKSSLSTRKASL